MSASGSSPTSGGDGNDWTVQIADTIESVVSSVRNKTTVPLVTAARGVVYGLVAGVFGAAIAILLTITLIRVIDIVLPIWATYLLLGGIFLAAGALLWRKAWSKPRS